VKQKIEKNPESSSSKPVDDEVKSTLQSNSAAPPSAPQTLDQWLEHNPKAKPDTSSTAYTSPSTPSQSKIGLSPAKFSAMNQELVAVDAEYSRLANSCRAFPVNDRDIKLKELKKETASKKSRIRKKYGVKEE